MSNGGRVTVDADEYLKLLDELSRTLGELRELGKEGFSSEKATAPPRPARNKKNESEPMELPGLDVSEIEWKKSNRDGGGPAGPNAGWAWAFALTQDGGIRREAAQLMAAIEQYGKVKIGKFEYTLGGRDGSLLNRKKAG